MLTFLKRIRRLQGQLVFYNYKRMKTFRKLNTVDRAANKRCGLIVHFHFRLLRLGQQFDREQANRLTDAFINPFFFQFYRTPAKIQAVIL